MAIPLFPLSAAKLSGQKGYLSWTDVVIKDECFTHIKREEYCMSKCRNRYTKVWTMTWKNNDRDIK